MPNYPLPKDTQAALATALRGAGVSNLSLYLNRYVEFEQGRDGYALDQEAKKYTYAPIDAYSQGDGQKLLTACVKRHRQTMMAARAKIKTAQPLSRCIVGLGAKGAREVGIHLHHLYGFPTIPGSALKGLARAAAVVAIFDALPKPLPAPEEQQNRLLSWLEEDIERYAAAKAEVKSANKSIPEKTSYELFYELFLTVFGAQSGAGDIIFFDALPEKLTLEVDIMNPHYPDYYNAKGKGNPPADYYSPTPINFLTVGSASSFVFGVASRTNNDEACRQAWDWLEIGLTTMGVGAKTTSGYGLFGTPKEK